jgi:hypothetical protein
MAAIGVASLAFDRPDAQASVNHGGQMTDRFCFSNPPPFSERQLRVCLQA